MLLRSFLVVVVCLLPGVSASSADKKPPKEDKVVGARWEYTAEKDGEKLTGKFRAYKKDLFIGEKKIGSIHPKDEDESKLIFTDLPEEKLNGEVVIRKTMKGDKPTWAGKLKTKEGDEWTFKATLVAR